jgi:transposase, IS30 family
MQKRTKYQQLQPEDRITIASMKQQGSSVRAMARTLERPASTISREIRRNSGAVTYASHTAQVSCACRRQAGRAMAKLDPRGLRWDVVVKFLQAKWSPQQIASTLTRVFPNDPDLHVSHETIYTAIYAQPRGELQPPAYCLSAPRS